MKQSVRLFLVHIFILMLAVVAGVADAVAFELDTYASQSKLASGRWVKVSVSATGIHFIPAASLRSWGFSNPEAVNVYGYGGNRISDLLSLDSYIDDLPQVQTVVTAQGIYFYAVGPVTWSRSRDNRFSHSLNPYSLNGYYFISDSGSKRDIPSDGFARLDSNPSEEYTAYCYHEKDEVSMSRSGHAMFGEDFRYTPSRTFSFSTPNHVEGTKSWMNCSFAAKNSEPGYIDFTANGTNINGSSRPSVGRPSGVSSGVRAVVRKEFSYSGDKVELGITYTGGGVVSAAYLDAIDINYRAKLSMNGAELQFSLPSSAALLSGAASDVKVWDVTDPLDIVAMNTLSNSNGLAWVNAYSGWRSYVAWNPGGSFPQPQYVCVVQNQNIHGITETPDMIILTDSRLSAQAERIAAMHRTGADKLDVLVVNHELLFDEFSSGMRDVNAYRRFAKMVYDRGKAQGKPLRYLLLMGRATYDNRGITSEMRALDYPFMATWQTDESLNESTTFSSDDIMAFLEDNSGASPGGDVYSIAVGRIPARTAEEASGYVDKMQYYLSNSARDQWRNKVMLVADNGNVGIHMEQADDFQKNALLDEDGKNLFFDKVYIDAFPLVAGVCQDARTRQFRLLDNGVMWWTYVGHGDPYRLTSEGILTFSDINNMYQRKYPVMYAATCSFLNWDGPNQCGSEIMALNPRGGAIAVISSTRSALISENGRLTRSMGAMLQKRDEKGMIHRLGDILKNAKNNISLSGSSSDNRTRYALLGDPAMRIALPSNRVVLETINGESVTPDNQTTIMARQQITLRGYVSDPFGSRLTDFNGTVSLYMYDAEYSTTSLGVYADDTEGKAVTFDEQGSLLFSGRTTVVNGEWSLNLTMPSEVTHNFRPAALNMYATTNDNLTDAVGCNRDFFVYGYDESAPADDMPPVVEYAYLNHESFYPGAVVNESPMFIAKVRDDVGINMSSAGIGHQMTIKVDDARSYSDVSLYYTPSSDGTPSGMIHYPMSELSNGNHTLSFRVWDTSGNSTTHNIEFFVKEGAKPQVLDIYTDVNPAVTHANFYVAHDRPDALASVTLTVYDMMGRVVWTATDTDRSNLSATAPITWHLEDLGGNRVPRGIYLYRATVKIDGEELTSEAKRIAVAAR